MDTYRPRPENISNPDEQFAIKLVESLEQLPDTIKSNGLTYIVKDKTGNNINFKSVFVNGPALRKEKIRLHNDAGNDLVYLIGRDSEGHIVGTQSLTLHYGLRKTAIMVSSVAKTVNRGTGMGSVMGEAFVQLLQDIADQTQKKVTWQVHNLNEDNIEDFRQQPNVDKGKLQEMEIEQQRWQALYGNGGKLGVVDGIRIFEPKE